MESEKCFLLICVVLFSGDLLVVVEIRNGNAIGHDFVDVTVIATQSALLTHKRLRIVAVVRHWGVLDDGTHITAQTALVGLHSYNTQMGVPLVSGGGASNFFAPFRK